DESLIRGLRGQGDGQGDGQGVYLSYDLMFEYGLHTSEICVGEYDVGDTPSGFLRWSKPARVEPSWSWRLSAGLEAASRKYPTSHMIMKHLDLSNRCISPTFGTGNHSPESLRGPTSLVWHGLIGSWCRILRTGNHGLENPKRTMDRSDYSGSQLGTVEAT
ncbi:hypothetical protein FOZ63_014586, partial [Perkinsus olseni]